jgi:hypothetical protein
MRFSYCILLAGVLVLFCSGCSKQESYKNLNYLEYLDYRRKSLNFIQIPHAASDISLVIEEAGSRQNKYTVSFHIEKMDISEVVGYISFINRIDLNHNGRSSYISNDKSFMLNVEPSGRIVVTLDDAYSQ